MIKVWHDQAWQDYLYWQQESRSMLKRINMLIRRVTGTGSLTHFI